MVWREKTSLGRLTIAAIIILLISIVYPSAAQEGEIPEKDKAAVLRGVANEWISVGLTQFNRGLYSDAQNSFKAAEDYQEYLTPGEKMKLEDNLAKTTQALAERKTVLDHLQKARELLNSGKPVEARADYEKVRNSPYLTEQEQSEIAGELKGLDAAFDKRRTEIMLIYNRSVALYRAGELEKARDGFAEVSKSGVLVAPAGQTAEDYLVQIDNILLSRFKGQTYAVPPPILAGPKAPTEEVNLPSTEVPEQQPETAPVPAVSNQPPATGEQEIQKPQQSIEEQVKEVKSAAEAVPEKPAKMPAAETEAARTKIIRDYTRAVVDDAEVKAQRLIEKGDYDKALEEVRSATQVVSENRPIIGDGEFIQYATRLKKLADKIVEARKK
jgi:tetratricopeptide (TPR) repeat protein